MTARWRWLWRALWRRSTVENDMAEELRFHIEARAADLARSGLPPADATRQARIEFGAVEKYKEHCREARGLRFFDETWADLRFAARALRKVPVFAVTVVATLALGIGAGTAIFSAVKAVLLNQLPYREPGRLVALGENDSGERRAGTVGYATVYDWRRLTHSFDSISLYRDAAGVLTSVEGAERLQGLRVNYDFFETLGISMQVGRGFLPEEDAPTRRREVVLSHDLWMRRFGADPSIVGRSINLSESPFLVVGVLPAGFQALEIPGSGKPEIFLPLGYALADPFACRNCQHLHAVARVKRAVPLQVARAELDATMADLVRQYPRDYPPRAAVGFEPLHENLVGTAGTALWILMGAAGLVWLMACVNVANLMLARGATRVKDLALRAALGATRARLVRHLVAESLVLALAGGASGLLLAWLCMQTLTSLAPPQIPRVHEIRIDAGVLCFALLASLLTAVLFGVAPAVREGRADAKGAAQDLARTTSDRTRSAFRNVLVMSEIALAFVLATGAGLLGRSFLRLMNVDPGFDPRHVLTLRTYVYGARYKPPEAALNYYRQVLDGLRATPGIEGAALTSALPLTDFDRNGFHIRDRRPARESDVPSADTYSVSPGYFHVMKIPIVRGRGFTEQDSTSAPRVAVISETCAREQFPGRDALGAQIQLGGRDDSKPWMTIVGISGDVRQYGLDVAPRIAAYMAQAQNLQFGFSLVARTAGNPEFQERAVRAAFQAVDATQPVTQVRSLEGYLDRTLAERRFTLTLLMLFGALALLLAAVGIYGVISYAVAARTREMGIRMALGAQRRDLLSMVMGHAALMAVAGLVAGAAASLALTRFLASLLFEVGATDLATWGATALLLAAVAFTGSFLPARRAAAADPTLALRGE